MTEMNVFAKLSKARVALQKRSLKKSGKNQYAGFSYFELSDFIPAINEIFAEIGLCSWFRITTDESGVQVAVLDIINTDKPEQKITFSSETAEAQMKGASAIQQLGSVHTYMRRYLWLEAMEITECDSMDAIDQKTQVDQEAPKKKERKADPVTEDQLQEMYQLFDGNDARLLAMMNAYEITELNQLNTKQAANIIKRMKGEAK